jgi:hypothetical protein
MDAFTLIDELAAEADAAFAEIKAECQDIINEDNDWN